ncbi:hypothetical protein [Altericroceibacterium spongiae]|nr:hypothetical protein [Altericroceibacterium spongiae]
MLNDDRFGGSFETGIDHGAYGDGFYGPNNPTGHSIGDDFGRSSDFNSFNDHYGSTSWSSAMSDDLFSSTQHGRINVMDYDDVSRGTYGDGVIGPNNPTGFDGAHHLVGENELGIRKYHKNNSTYSKLNISDKTLNIIVAIWMTTITTILVIGFLV